jgi:hypothetical protein
MWNALDVAAGSQRLQGYDFQQLATSAEMQYAEFEDRRLEYAKAAFKRAA